MNCRNISLEDICILPEDTILKIDCIMGVQLKVLYGITQEQYCTLSQTLKENYKGQFRNIIGFRINDLLSSKLKTNQQWHYIDMFPYIFVLLYLETSASLWCFRSLSTISHEQTSSGIISTRSHISQFCCIQRLAHHCGVSDHFQQ